jgi:uncharacterized membrane protein
MDTRAPEQPAEPPELSAADIGALAHLYRGEVYRSTIWRTRLDNTTNWAVATIGIALSVSFSSPDASPLPLVLVGFLIVVFLVFEARRYRYFNVWRARARWMETNLFAPMLTGDRAATDPDWRRTLARDYCAPRHHITLARAVGRRLRRTYIYILTIQGIAYLGKIAVHPKPVATWDELFARAVIGPIPGEAVIVCGFLFHAGWLIAAYVTWRQDRVRHRQRLTPVAMG